jgi:hypothetical protein
MHINSGLLFWGLALVTAGIVALASAQGWIDIPAWVDLWRYWPVILIVIGLAIVLSRTPFALIGTVVAALVVGIAGGAAIAAAASGAGFGTCGNVSGTEDTSSGDFSGGTASVDLTMNCGDLTLGMADGSAWQAVTVSEEDQGVSLEADADSLTMRSNTGGFPFNHDRQDWTVTLGRDLAYDLALTLNATDSRADLTGGQFARIEANPNAGSLQLDLSGSQVEELQLQVNAGSLTLDTDAGTQLGGRIGVNAGSIDLCTDPDVGLRITVDANLTFAHNLDESGLQQSGEDTFTSDNYASATNTIDLELEGNAASFTLNPEKGCA